MRCCNRLTSRSSGRLRRRLIPALGYTDMTLMPEDREMLEKLQQAFQDCPRPEHFTNFDHCEECAEHDRTLLSRTPDTLKIEDVGNPGWEPMCFTAPAGFAYYLPSLARIVFEEPPYGYCWYGNQLFWHLISDGPGNARYLHCSPEQRKAVTGFVKHLIETRAEQIEAECVEDDAIRALEIWSNGDAA
jgi:hypothetical protein